MSLCCCWFKGLGQCAFFDVHTNCRHKKFLLHSQPTITASFPAHYHSLLPSPLSQPHSQPTITASFPAHYHSLIPSPLSQPHSQPTITASFPAHYHSLIPSPLSQPHSQIITFAVCSMVAKEMQLAVWEWDCFTSMC